MHQTQLKIQLFAFIAATVIFFTPLNGTCAEDRNEIVSLNSTNGPNGSIVLTIGLKSEPKNAPTAFAVNTPPRIAFDFADTTSTLPSNSQDFGSGVLRSANIIQAGGRTRLVANLTQMLSYDMHIEGNKVIVTLQNAATTNTSSNQHFAAASGQLAQKHAIQDIDFHRSSNGGGRLQVDLSDANISVDIKQQGRLLLIDFANTALPANLQRKLDVTDFATPVQMVDAFNKGSVSRLTIEAKSPWEYSAYQADNKFFVEVKPKVADTAKVVRSTQPSYTGEKLTLNFQNISTREALSVIADFTGLNMVISDTVGGNLTLRLKDVPWDQALDIILQTRGLDKRKNGNVMQVAPREEIAAREKIDLSAKQEIGELEATHTESFDLSYAKAADMVTLLKNKDTGLLSKRGTAVSDTRTNTLFVQDTGSHLEEVRKFIKQLDIPVRQVLIEARFVEATESFARTLGGRVGYTGPATSIAGGGFPIGLGQRGAAAPNVNLPGANAGVGGLTLTLFNRLATKILTLELNASELDGTTKSIASPRVVTGDKQDANIESGVEVPYLQATSSGATNVAFKKAVLGLKVTPQITPDDRIGMKVSVSQDTVGNIYSGVPSINTKKVDTQVLVENGGTVVIGGVYTQDETDSTQQVPLFGDIPLIGWFFKTNTITKSRKELLVFITPKIMRESLGME